MSRLTSVSVAGWKSIKCIDPLLQLDPINVFIGANGAGKSNLISFFKMLNEMMGENLQDYIAVQGGADSLLHFGSKATPHVEATLNFDTETGASSYVMRLAYAAVDTLIFTEESLEFQRTGHPTPKPPEHLGPGHRETKLRAASAKGDKTADVFRYLISHCRVFHFHDTSETAKPRQSCYVEANRHLYPDAGNLAAMLYLYQSKNSTVYRRIVSAVRKIAPFLDDFVLEPRRLDPTKILLKWKARDTDYEFGPHQLSDGTLRGIALATLLLQPVDDLPDAIVIDEPELGLHPHAIEIIAGLVRSVSHRTQVILATQSTAFVDHFTPDEIVVTEIDRGCSKFRRLDTTELADWLEDYSVSQLWEKNVLGGGTFDVKTLYVFCEGKTEQGFCGQVLAPHLYPLGFSHIPTIRVVNSRSRGVATRGGVTSYEALRRDILNTLKSRTDDNVFFTSMIDLYGLPKKFPGKSDYARNANDPMPYVEALELAFANDIGDRRFVPHLQLYEYETLLYAGPEAFEIAFENCQHVIDGLRKIARDFPSIEHINDDVNTAPSKRIVDLLPEYQGRKSTAGPDIAESIGLRKLRAACPHFHKWISAIERLGD